MASHCLFVSALLCLAVPGCASYRPDTVAPISEISLTTALVDVIDALNAARARSNTYEQRIGLNPCTVTATFNVGARATDGGKLELGVTVGPPVTPVGASAGGEVSRIAEGNRGNQVTVFLTSAACLPEGSLGATKPDQIRRAQEEIADSRSGSGPFFSIRPGQ